MGLDFRSHQSTELWGIPACVGIERHQPCLLGAEFQDTPFPFVFQIGACGYIEKLVQNSCWLIQAFSLACTVKGYKMREYEKQIWERRDRRESSNLNIYAKAPEGRR